MHTQEHENVLKDLLDTYCPMIVVLKYVDNVQQWCNKNGHSENESDKPLKLIADDDKGCKLVVGHIVKPESMDKRINALSIRSTLHNIAHNRAEKLNSDKKKLAYLFINEYASALPDLQSEQDTDDWVFNEMEKRGFFRE
jgi:hypothetical protein